MLYSVILSIAFLPKMGGQSERTKQTLEDMLMSCILSWKGGLEDHFPLVQFAYNNSYHASIHCSPFEERHGRKGGPPLCWRQLVRRQF